jgi:hypothetical protein
MPGAPTSTLNPLATYLMPQLAKQRPALKMLIHWVGAWLQGCGIRACTSGSAFNCMKVLIDMGIDRKEPLECLAVAQYFTPSPELVSTLGKSGEHDSSRC